MKTTKKFGIWCIVYGGITGHREGWYKDSQGIVEFATLEEAQAAVDEATNRTAKNPNAFFRYEVCSL